MSTPDRTRTRLRFEVMTEDGAEIEPGSASLWEALRRHGLIRIYSRPLTTYSAVVWDTSNASDQKLRRKQEREGSRADFKRVRALAMMVGPIAFWVPAAVLFLPFHGLPYGWRLGLGVIAATMVMAVAAVVAVAQILGAWAQPAGLLDRVAHSAFGRQVDQVSWLIAFVTGGILAVVAVPHH